MVAFDVAPRRNADTPQSVRVAKSVPFIGLIFLHRFTHRLHDAHVTAGSDDPRMRRPRSLGRKTNDETSRIKLCIGLLPVRLTVGLGNPAQLF